MREKGKICVVRKLQSGELRLGGTYCRNLGKCGVSRKTGKEMGIRTATSSAMLPRPSTSKKLRAGSQIMHLERILEAGSHLD